jgi:uncharacterized membrane protein
MNGDTRVLYHIGIGKRKNTMVIQACRCVDFLSCEIYDYMGQRMTTKKTLRENRYHILAMMQNQKPDVYGNLKYAIVE